MNNRVMRPKINKTLPSSQTEAAFHYLKYENEQA
jgi:hypothetical protein